MASRGETGERKRRPLSQTGPRRKGRRLEDEDAGFATYRHVDTQEKSYNHDRESIKFSSSIIGKAGEKLYKLQEDIRRKSKKEKSKWLEKCKTEYDQRLADLVTELKRLMPIVCEKEDNVPQSGKSPGQCAECFHREKDMFRLHAENDSLNQQLRRQKEAEQDAKTKNEEGLKLLSREIDSLKQHLSQEREAKQEALTRLSAMTSSRLRDNNPNLTDLSDPYRPSKIGEMFSELYDNEWTNAYDELSQSKHEVETIEQLNTLVMTAYDCCMKLSKPSQLYLDTSLTKIDSELRQKIIGHFKQNAMVVIPYLKQGLEKEIFLSCSVTNTTKRVVIYIQKCIEVCWLMVIQDPPMCLDSFKPEKFDSSRYREYQHKGMYTDYVVWPAIALYKEGPLLSKGVAEGSSAVKMTGRSKSKHDKMSDVSMSQTWHPSRANIRNQNHQDEVSVCLSCPVCLCLRSGTSSVDISSPDDYSHDICSIKQSTLILDHNAKTLEKLQNEIVRRTKKDKNGLIGLYKGKYKGCLSRMRQEVKHLVSNIFDNECELASVTVDQTAAVPKTTISDGIWREEIQRLQAIVDRLTREVAVETKAKEDALLRYSALAGSQLKDKHPTLTHVSDVYSPTKIAEMYLELYDNEWMDAYEELESTMSDEETVQTLRDIIMCAFASCKKLTEPMHLYLDTDYTKINSEFRQKVISHLKQNSMIVIPKVKEILLPDICERCGLTRLGPNISSYIDRCVEVCWLMVIQDPPMHLDKEKPDKFDTTKFKVYTKYWPHVAYIVWPAVFLCENGSLLGRGVAQGAKTRGSR